jgi:hypothetical protein
MPTHFTPTRFAITFVVIVLTGIGFKQTLLAQHVGAVTKNAGAETISHCPKAEPNPVKKLRDMSFA